MNKGKSVFGIPPWKKSLDIPPMKSWEKVVICLVLIFEWEIIILIFMGTVVSFKEDRLMAWNVI